jgi:hypothetical protein
MDNFVTRENIKRYRRLAGEATDPAERSRIKATVDVSRQGDATEGRSPIHTATGNPVEHDEERQRSGS